MVFILFAGPFMAHFQIIIVTSVTNFTTLTLSSLVALILIYMFIGRKVTTIKKTKLMVATTLHLNSLHTNLYIMVRQQKVKSMKLLPPDFQISVIKIVTVVGIFHLNSLRTNLRLSFETCTKKKKKKNYCHRTTNFFQ